MAGVFGHFSVLPLTPPGIEVLDGRELGPSNVLACPHHPLWCFAVEGDAFAMPSGEAASQNVLDGAALEPFEDPRAS